MSIIAAHRLTGVAVDRENREKDDFYPTPPEGTLALLRAESFDGPIWEPACGDGAISRVLEAAGYRVVSTDLVDRGYGEPRVDFLMENRSIGEPIPRGWRLAPHRASHHSRYSILIARKPAKRTKRKPSRRAA